MSIRGEIIQKIFAALAIILRELNMLQSQQQTTTMLQPEMLPIPPQPQGNPDLLHAFCMAIQLYEGYIIPGGKDASGNKYPDGSPAYRNKNPGNLRCMHGDKQNWNYLAITCTADNFCVFPTYEIGFQALVNVTLKVVKGLSSLYSAHAKSDYGLADSGEMNLLQYFTVRDPSSDGNFPAHFAGFMAKQIGVDIATFKMKNLL